MKNNRKPLSLSDLTSEEFNREMLKAHNDFKEGRVYTLEEVENTLKKELKLTEEGKI